MISRGPVQRSAGGQCLVRTTAGVSRAEAHEAHRPGMSRVLRRLVGRADLNPSATSRSGNRACPAVQPTVGRADLNPIGRSKVGDEPPAFLGEKRWQDLKSPPLVRHHERLGHGAGVRLPRNGRRRVPTRTHQLAPRVVQRERPERERSVAARRRRWAARSRRLPPMPPAGCSTRLQRPRPREARRPGTLFPTSDWRIANRSREGPALIRNRGQFTRVAAVLASLFRAKAVQHDLMIPGCPWAFGLSDTRVSKRHRKSRARILPATSAAGPLVIDPAARG